MVRDVFRLARENSPCIIFIDEVDAIATKRFDAQTGSDREVQRILLELLNQMDGFDQHSNVKVCCSRFPRLSLNRHAGHHGYKSTRYTGSCSFETRSSRSQNRIPDAFTKRETINLPDCHVEDESWTRCGSRGLYVLRTLD